MRINVFIDISSHIHDAIPTSFIDHVAKLFKLLRNHNIRIPLIAENCECVSFLHKLLRSFTAKA